MAIGNEPPEVTIAKRYLAQNETLEAVFDTAKHDDRQKHGVDHMQYLVITSHRIIIMKYSHQIISIRYSAILDLELMYGSGNTGEGYHSRLDIRLSGGIAGRTHIIRFADKDFARNALDLIVPHLI